MTSDVRKKWAALIVGVDRATRAGKIKWAPDPEVPSTKDDFVATFNGYQLNIYKHEGSHGIKIIFRVLTMSGDAVDVFNDESLRLADLRELGAEAENTYGFMQKLVAFVSRKASGADDVLDTLIAGLNES